MPVYSLHRNKPADPHVIPCGPRLVYRPGHAGHAPMGGLAAGMNGFAFLLFIYFAAIEASDAGPQGSGERIRSFVDGVTG